MLGIFSRDRHPEVEGDDITVVVAAVGKIIYVINICNMLIK